jgi:hypothetical protein
MKSWCDVCRSVTVLLPCLNPEEPIIASRGVARLKGIFPVFSHDCMMLDFHANAILSQSEAEFAEIQEKLKKIGSETNGQTQESSVVLRELIREKGNCREQCE